MPVGRVKGGVRTMLLAGAVVTLLLSSGLHALAQQPPATAPVPVPGLDLTSLDPKVHPGDDFNRYANGRGLDRIVIAPDREVFSPFTILADRSEERLHQLVEAAAARPAPASSTAGKMGLLYRSFMDEERIEGRGTAVVAEDISRLRNARSREELIGILSRDRGGFHASVVELGISPDPRAPGRYAVMVGQPILGLPERDYYLDERFERERLAYVDYISRLLREAGIRGASPHAIIRFETSLAKANWSRADRRDPGKIYNPVAAKDLGQVAPGLPWNAILAKSGLAGTRNVVLLEKSAVTQAAAIAASTDLETLRGWAIFRLLDKAAPYLPRAFADAHFRFRSATLNGIEQRQPRWKRAIETLNSHMSDAIGQVYVEKFFSSEQKRILEGLIAELLGSMKHRIEKAEWMAPATKSEALNKLASFKVEVGYPSKWRDYGRVRIRDGDLYGNVRRLGLENWRFQVERRNGPVDRGQWVYGPQAATAYNISAFNKVVFPAAILQPPFFDPAADDAVNFGAIGALIGHEITHGFDDKGRRFDASGALRDWWTPVDAKNFEARAQALVKQYSGYEPLPGVKVNGALTLGENIADLGGVSLALDAYHARLKGRPAPVIGGLTGDQRFFLSWAQVWRGKRREQFLRQMVVSHPHSPDEFRINGVLPHIDAWYDAFGVKAGNSMYRAPEQRVRIW
jgi:putative endopeptidase